MTTTTGSTRRPSRALAVLTAMLAVVLAIVLLTPSGRTQAAWSDGVDVDVPAATTGNLSLAVSGAVTGSTTVVPSGTVSSTWRPASVRVLANGGPLTGAQLAGSRIEYRAASSGACATASAATFTAAPAGAGTTFAVAGGTAQTGTRTLCVTLVPGDALRASHAGVQLSVETTLSATQPGSGTWTAGTSWTTTQQLPALPAIGTLDCSPLSNDKFVQLTWTWVDQETGATSTASVERWRVEHRVATSGWAPMFDEIAPESRSLEIKWQDLPQQFQRNSIGHIRIVAELPDGSTVVSDQIGLSTSTQRGGTVTCR
ncbi:MAG: hypothetical protein ACTMKU_07365 [Actinomycetaceae bacterium]